MKNTTTETAQVWRVIRLSDQSLNARVARLRTRFILSRTQCFIEGRTLTLQALPQDTAGTFGCEWQAGRGESLHAAIDEAEEYLATRKTARDFAQPASRNAQRASRQ